MSQRLKEVDVVVIGMGIVGSIVSKELAAAGYRVVGLERGQRRFTAPDFQSPAVHDELRFDVRHAMMQDNTREAVTFRNHDTEVALPLRRWGSFLPGTGLGGSMAHWNGQTYRFTRRGTYMATEYQTTHNTGGTVTDTVGALTYWAVQAMKTMYLRNPGPLVPA